MPGWDVIVVGLGTVGAATCMTLARRGVAVLGLDAFRPPHEKGSHHGESRSIRRAYLEGTTYVPMARRAWELWRRLEKDTGVRLLTPTGNLTIGPEAAPAVQGFLASARRYDIPHALLSASEVRRRWPVLALPDDFVAGLEKEAGIVFPEKALAVMLSEAEKAGAELHFGEAVEAWSDGQDDVRVRAARGSYSAGRLLLAAGAGNHSLLGRYRKWIRPQRVPVHWLAPDVSKHFALGHLPVNFWQLPMENTGTGDDFLEMYALPIVRPGGRVKVASHNRLQDCDPLLVERRVEPQEVADVRRFVAAHLPPLAAGDCCSSVCLYTMTPDGDFILGPLPDTPNVMMAALAGHGFKFAPVLGAILADMLEGRSSEFDMAPFSLRRFVARS